MQTPVNRLQNQQGSSLVAVFWLIGVLGLSILAAAKFVALDAQWIKGLKSTSIARNHAATGLAIASHPAITPADPLLRWLNPAETGGYTAEVSSEEALIPLNHVLFHGRKEVVRNLFILWGLSPDEASSVVDAMVDWTDENDLTSLHGAEAGDYSDRGQDGFPFNRPFQTLEEVEFVMGMREVKKLKPNWKEYFTLWSVGQIDLNEANEEIIAAALSSVDVGRISEFAIYRNGLDGIKGTLDDQRFTSVSDVLVFLGTTPRPDLPLLTVRGSTRRIVSTGFFNDYSVKISETRRGNDLLWRSEY